MLGLRLHFLDFTGNIYFVRFLKKITVGILFFVSLTFGLMSNVLENADKEFQVSWGYRTGDLDWNIAGTNNIPNILSELTWSDLEIYQFNLNGSISFENHIYLKTQYSLGVVADGKNQDSDYANNNRTAEFSRSNNDVTGNNIYDIGLGLGYEFDLTNSQGTFPIQFVPLFGYSYQVMNFNIVNGFQTIPATGSFSGLNSTYRSEWSGWWAGFELRVKPIQNWELMFGYDIHKADYNAEADWNLRTDLDHPVSFENNADANGVKWNVTVDYQLNEQWFLRLMMDHQKWHSKRGTNKINFVGGNSSYAVLNEVNWESDSYNLGLGCQF